ncbi:hypothetical protein GGI43DRAFT_214511 [Trichoderma evansii]
MKAISFIISPLVAASSMADAAYEFKALGSASPIEPGSINANGGKFWIGKETRTHCPSSVEDEGRCPMGKVTALIIHKQNGTSSLNTLTPGDQRVYIGPTGAFSFSHPQSLSTPLGSIVDGFELKWESDGLIHLTNKAGAWRACPAGEDGKDLYQVYAAIDGFKMRNCLEFSAVTGVPRDVPAEPVWQYD